MYAKFYGFRAAPFELTANPGYLFLTAQHREALSNLEYGLSCAIYTRDIGATFTAINELEFGVVYVNAPTIGAEVQLPFGGMKGTGNGHREAGPQALDEFTEWKAVSVDFSGRVQKAQMGD